MLLRRHKDKNNIEEKQDKTLEDMTVKELKPLAEEKNIDIKGLKKDQIIKALQEVEV